MLTCKIRGKSCK